MQQYLNFIKYRSIPAVERLEVKYLIAFGLGIVVGFKVIPLPILAGAYLLLIGICLIKGVQKSLLGFFTFLPYAMYAEIIIRARATWVPYLTVQYLLIATFAYFIVTGVKGNKNHFFGFIFLALYTALEVINNIYPSKFDVTRSILVQSFTLLLTVVWASYTVLSPQLILRLLTHLKIAGVFLTGVIVVAHLTGGIDYGQRSSSEASNGLAPVQLSGYLGLICILFFFSIMNVEEIKNQWLNIILLTLVGTVMILTFSRGGVYFIGAIAGCYILYNRARIGNYFKFLVLIPIGAIIYFSAIETTGGKIVERYSLEGSSGRDKLVMVAFKLFGDHPFFGIGTGNFNTEILKRGLYPVESGVHNEFARAAAEHGIIGIIFYWGFFLFLFINIYNRPQPQRQFAMYFLILFCLIVVHNGLKISIQPLILMLAVSITSTIPKKIPNNARRYKEEAVA